MFVVRCEILKALLDDTEWSHKLKKAKTMQQVECVLREFAEAKGYKIREITPTLKRRTIK